MRNWRLEAFFIAVGLIVSGFIIKSGITSQTKERIVSVKGTAEKEVTAEKVIWPVVFKDLNNELSYLHYSIHAKNKIVTDFLKANGITDEEICIVEPEVSDTQTDRQILSRPYHRYAATSVIVVTSTDVRKVRELILIQNQLLKQNIAIVNDEPRYKVKYEFAGMEALKSQLTEEAVKNARASAETFAANSDSKAGKLRNISQEQIRISDKSVEQPHVQKVKMTIKADYYLTD